MYISENSKVVIQGITGTQGMFHTKLMVEYGTNIVAGVTPGKGGQEVDSIPVFNEMREVTQEIEADVSIIFVPARFTLAAAMES